MAKIDLAVRSQEISRGNQQQSRASYKPSAIFL